MSLRSGLVSLVLVSVLQSTLIVPAVFAAGTPVKVAGQSIFNIDSNAGGLTAIQRAEKIQRNLDNALIATANPGAESVSIVYVKGQPIVTVGGYYVATVDAVSAKQANTTPALLAKRWADSLKRAMANKSSVKEYIAQLSGDSGITPVSSGASGPSGSSPSVDVPRYDDSSSASAAGSSQQTPYVEPYARGKVVYIPAGMTIPVKLATALTSNVAKPGDLVEARVSETISLGDAVIPANSQIIGQVTESTSGARMSKSGSIAIKFTKLRTPDGAETPIEARIQGNIGEHKLTAGVVKGEDLEAKVKHALISTAIGAGSGALAGTTIGGIAGKGRGAGKGAWSGAAIGAGLGLAQSLLLRKGGEVQLMQGAPFALQLDAPATVLTR